jgi:uracil-DNA glycosylase
MMDFMATLDRDFRDATGIRERRHYKIFYSHVHPFPLLVLGQNPGGASDGTDLCASDGFYENWEHDYVHFRADARYRLAGPACDLLASALGASSPEELRRIPASNVIFRRSRNTAGLRLSPARAAEESKPFVERLLQAVDPKAILFFSGGAFDLFMKHHALARSWRPEPAPAITTPNGRSEACLFKEGVARVPTLGREVSLIMVGHPSKYGSRAEWPAVTSALGEAFRRIGLRPLEAAVIQVSPDGRDVPPEHPNH